jgi:sporulation protein YlmC with PRC-barrel domain
VIASCARLVGEPVFDRKGGEAGRIDRLLVDVASGRVTGLVIAVGGVFGLGERQYTLPWSAVRVDARRRRIIIERKPQETAAESPLSTL